MGARGKDRRLEGWPQALLAVTSLFLLAPFAVAQPTTPVISSGGLVNAASFLPADISSGAIAQGSMFSLFGADLSIDTASVVTFPLPRLLAGTEVEVIAAGNVYTAPLLYVSSSQINGIFPSDVPVGSARVRIVRSGLASNWEEIKVVRSYPGLYLANHLELGFASYRNQRHQAAAQRVIGGEAQQLQQDRPAYPGGVVTLWATGLGGVTGGDDTPVGVAGRRFSQMRALVGGKEATILYQDRSSCCVGLDQVNVLLPLDVSLGCHVPVQLVGGGLPSNVTTIPIAASESEFCPGYEVRPSRIYLDRRWVDDQPFDTAWAIHGRLWRDPSELPPAGSCQATAPSSIGSIGVEGFSSRKPLIEVSSPTANFELSDDGFAILSAPDGAAQLGAGIYTVSSTGGHFPDYQATLQVPSWAISRWSLGDQVNPRDDGLQWDGLFVSPTTNPTETLKFVSIGNQLVCIFEPGTSSFTISPDILALLHGPLEWSLGFLASAPFEFDTDSVATGQVVYTEVFNQTYNLGPVRLPTIPVILPNGDIVRAEIATTAAEHQRGLMNRPALAPDRGMLFFFAAPGFHSFWMAETLIPLDIIRLDSNRKIVTISADTPPCPPNTDCPIYSPDALAMYVLELGAGEAARRGLRVNDQLSW